MGRARAWFSNESPTVLDVLWRILTLLRADQTLVPPNRDAVRRHKQESQAKQHRFIEDMVCPAETSRWMTGANLMHPTQSSCYPMMGDARSDPQNRLALEILLQAIMRSTPADRATPVRDFGSEAWKWRRESGGPGSEPRAQVPTRTGSLDPSGLLPVSDRGATSGERQKTSATIRTARFFSST